MSNTEYLRSLYAAMDGLLTDLDANGSAEMAANSLRYHLKEHGLSIRPAEAAAPRAEGDECTTPKWCAENGCQHRMSLVELLRVESRLGEDGYRLVPLDDAIRAVNAVGAAPRAEGLDPLREAALRVILAQEAVRDAINGLGHPDEPHDSVLGDIRRDPTDEVQIIDTVGDCALCGGMQYGSEDTLNRAFGELRAALGLEVRPWEFPEDAARWLSSLSRPSDEREAASPAALDVTRAIEEICGDLSHYDLSDDPGYIKVPTERVIAILCARLTEQEDRHD